MIDPHVSSDGTSDLASAVEALADRLPEPLWALASLAYNYWWSWVPEGEDLFRGIAPQRWDRCGNNPVRLLEEVRTSRLETLAESRDFVRRVGDMQERLDAEFARAAIASARTSGPLAYFSAEFGIHASLPFYAGGLGVLAGDFLKESSDRAAPVIGVGLFYNQGSFHQRLDTSGWQHEYWLGTDADRLPGALVTAKDGTPLSVRVPVHGRSVAVHVWRFDIGTVPLYLLDSDHPDNASADRWITARVYVGNRDLRLAQYALLGIGGVKALRAMDIDPALFHLNEGHAALSLLELLREQSAAGQSFEAAKEQVRSQTRFTTHTPVAAGNESFTEDHLRSILPDLNTQTGVDWPTLMSLARVHPDDATEPFGLTPLALRLSGSANGVSQLHGVVSRTMWRDIWPSSAVDEVPIAHVTNGVHRPTWMAPEMAALVGRYVREWNDGPSGPGTWDGVLEIPDEELWEVRNTLRRRLAALIRERSITDRLGRGATVDYAESAADQWSDNVLTVGFARRIATYKRLYLITFNVERGLRLLRSDRSLQLAIAGRAHPLDEEAKRSVQRIFALNDIPDARSHVVFLDDHDMDMAKRLVQGCDLWVNLPRVPQEASGTSGMKSVLNGGLQLSVLDGWWAEAYQPGSGWGIHSDASLSWEEQDRRDAEAFLDLLEFEVIPLFYDRDAQGIPGGWLQTVKASLALHGPQYVATRMLRDYGFAEPPEE